MIPLCAECHFWRDYSDPWEMEHHPDYDGHCILLGIMTLDVQECSHLNEVLHFRKLPEFSEPKPILSDEDYVKNPWIEWKEQKRKGLIHE